MAKKIYISVLAMWILGERPFKCPFEGCERSFTTSNIRKVHIRTHTGERPYICNEEGCGRAFASATNYKNHIRIHTGVFIEISTAYRCVMYICIFIYTLYLFFCRWLIKHVKCLPLSANTWPHGKFTINVMNLNNCYLSNARLLIFKKLITFYY